MAAQKSSGKVDELSVARDDSNDGQARDGSHRARTRDVKRDSVEAVTRLSRSVALRPLANST